METSFFESDTCQLPMHEPLSVMSSDIETSRWEAQPRVRILDKWSLKMTMSVQMLCVNNPDDSDGHWIQQALFRLLGGLI